MKKTISLIKMVILVSIISIFLACQKPAVTFTIAEEDGIEVISNSGQPDKPKLKVELKELFTLQGYDEELNPDENAFYHLKKMTITPDGSIYIFDDTSYCITKYNSNGEYELNFLKQGEGPGEILRPNFIRLYSNSLEIIVQEYYTMHFFNFEGIYLETRTMNETVPFRIPMKMLPLTNNTTVMTRLGLDVRGDDRFNDGFFIKDIALCDSTFTPIKVLPETIELAVKDRKKDVDNSFITKFTLVASENLIYVYNRSKWEYRIDCYDLELNKTKTILMPTDPIKYSQNELEFIEENFVGSYVSEKYWKEIFDTKLCLNYLHFDKTNNLLIAEKVANLDSNSVSFDVFRDGVYLNSFEYKIDPEDYHPMNQDFMFKVQDGRFYAYSETNNRVKVFEIGI